MSTSETIRENCVTTAATANDVLATVQSDAKALLAEICEFDPEHVAPLLKGLRDTLAKARLQGVSEVDIAGTLDEVRQSEPEVTESWIEILGQVTVNVWLEDPDCNRICAETVVIDRIIWEHCDEESTLEDSFLGLRDDIGVRWEVVDE